MSLDRAMSDFPAAAVNPAELSWQERALCAQTDPEAFFPEKGGNAGVTKIAIQICNSCRFKNPCLEYALLTFPQGIWGGTTERQRRVLRKQKSQP